MRATEDAIHTEGCTMTLNQLSYYLAVCKHQNLTKAAAELSVSQPGLSVSMRELEEECGFPLFERRPNSIRLTQQGRAFQREAEHLLGQYRRLQQHTELIARENSILRVGVATMGAGGVFPRLRRRFAQACPEITLEVTEDSTERLYHKIDQGELDFAVTVSIALPGEDYGYVTLSNSRLLLCANRDNSVAKQKPRSLKQLGDTPLILLSERSSQTKYLKRLLERAGCTPNVIQYSDQAFTILQYIRENAACGFLPEDIAAQESGLACFPMFEIDMASVTAIWRKDRQSFVAFDQFIRYLKKSGNR